MSFLELKTRSGSRFMIDFVSGWQIQDKGSDAALWCNHEQARNLDCGETYEELRAKLLPMQIVDATLRLDRSLVERASDMLTAYAELIRRDGASHVEEHHYLPEVEHTASELRQYVFVT